MNRRGADAVKKKIKPNKVLAKDNFAASLETAGQPIWM
jgi:hypothetical protein